MPFLPVEKSLGKRYPDTPEDVVAWIQRVLGPTIDELRTRYNEIHRRVGIQIEDTEAELSAIDTSELKDGSLGIVADTRTEYSLERGGVVGGSDLAATPAGRWKFERNL